MRRTLFAVVLVVAAAAGTTAQDKKDVKAPNLYPLTKGTKWEYELAVAGQKLEAVQEVTEIAEPKEKGGRAVATISGTVGPQKLTEEISTDEKGVYRHAMQGQKLETPVLAVKYPVKEGDKWDAKIAIAGQEVEAKFELKKAEKVKVPAGEYSAYPVEMVVTAMGQTINATNWYADGVGMVKQEVSFAGTNITMELKKFTAGK